MGIRPRIYSGKVDVNKTVTKLHDEVKLYPFSIAGGEFIHFHFTLCFSFHSID